MNDPVGGALSMGKTQKTVILNDQVCHLVQQYADKKATNFQRVVQAAVLQYFCGSTEGPDEAWLEAAVLLEKDRIQLPEVPIRVLEEYATTLQRKIALRKEKGATDSDVWIAWAQKQMEHAYSDAGLWRGSTTLFGGDLDGFIEVATTDITERYQGKFPAQPEQDAE